MFDNGFEIHSFYIFSVLVVNQLLYDYRETLPCLPHMHSKQIGNNEAEMATLKGKRLGPVCKE